MDFLETSPVRPDNWFAEHVPNLDESACVLHSKRTWDYNCVGFVAGDFRWWHWDYPEIYYWPEGIDRGHWCANYMAALSTVGFTEQTYDPGYDERFQTIAVYHKGGVFKHVAMQIGDLAWHSKLGEYEDLIHPLNALVGPCYGSVFRFMRRPKPEAVQSIPEEYLLNM